MAGRHAAPQGGNVGYVRARDESTMLPDISTKCRKKSPDKPIRPIAGVAQFAFLCRRDGGFILMGVHTGFRLLAVFIGLLSTIRAHAGCVDPAQLAHSTVSILRYFDEAERDASSDLMGIRGTGWFLSPTTIVTAAHVVEAMKLSAQDWKPLEIADEHGSRSIAARLKHLAGDQAEKLAVIELQNAVFATHTLKIRREPLVPEDQVVTLVYPEGLPHFVQGRFVQLGNDERLAGTVLLEMYEGDNRLIVDHGASGAPVIDCDGRVAAVISNVFTQSVQWASRQIRTSTPWGTPNVVSVPVQVLKDLPQVD
jgi:S1-C subfamily serine protease